MILNAPILISLLLAGLGLVLGLAAAAARIDVAIRPQRHGEGLYLVFLILLTAFGLRLIAWPLWYVALAGAVPHVSGAMCIFGVTRLAPGWSTALEVVRPLLVLVLGGWLTLRLVHSRAERRQPGTPAPRPALEHSLLLAALVLLPLEGLLDLRVLSALRPDSPAVYCCGSVFDLPDRWSALVPGHLLGASHAALLLPLVHLLGIVAVAVSLLAGWRVFKGCRFPAFLPAMAVLALLPTALAAGMEVITPRLTGLPYHHCLYCLLGRTTAGPWLAAALLGGALAVCWGSLAISTAAGRRAGAMLLFAGALALLLFIAILGLTPIRGGGAGDLGDCPVCTGAMHDTVYLVELVQGREDPLLFCSIGCALQWINRHGGETVDRWVTVRDEFTGERLDAGAAHFVEAAREIDGLPPGNRWHVYQYLENAHVMAFQLDGNVGQNPFGRGESMP
jgi:hypothetical protein